MTVHSGGTVWDWELANMIKMWIGDKGYANMMFIFNQCFAGGMMDDLEEKLRSAKGDVAMMGAARHNEPSWGLKDGWTGNDSGFTKPEDFFAKEAGEELAKTGNNAPAAKQMANTAENEDILGPKGTKKENPQYSSLGNGDKIKIGKKANGKPVKSKHAIMFMGDPNGERHWNNLERAHQALRAHGFTESGIIILAGDGQKKSDGSNVPAYVDGNGTKAALFDAIKKAGKKMNKNEQFVFWSSDHGNRDRTDLALKQAIKDTVKQEIPTSDGKDWDVDEKFKEQIKLPGSSVFVSLFLDKELTEDQARDIKLYWNDTLLAFGGVEPVVGLDDRPDVDGTDVRYHVDATTIPDQLWRFYLEGGDLIPTLRTTIIGLGIGVDVPTQTKDLTDGTGGDTGAASFCSSGPTSWDATYRGVAFYYEPGTGDCATISGMAEPGGSYGGYLLFLSPPYKTSTAKVAVGNSYWELVSATAGTVVPGQFGSIEGIPVNAPFDIVLKCSGSGCPSGKPEYTGSITIGPSTAAVKNFRKK